MQEIDDECVVVTKRGEAETLKSLNITEFYKKKLLEGIITKSLDIFMVVLQQMQRNVETFISQEKQSLTEI